MLVQSIRVPGYFNDDGMMQRTVKQGRGGVVDEDGLQSIKPMNILTN